MLYVKAIGCAVMLFVLSCTDSAAEYGCPDGYVPINSQNGGGSCVVDYNLPYWNDRGTSSVGPTQQRALWADRWGALVINPKTGIMGVAEDETSKRDAERTAYAQCGSGCKSMIVYHNQCIAAGWNDVFFTANGGATIAIATDRAQRECRKSGKSCEIVYTACSPAERVR